MRKTTSLLLRLLGVQQRNDDPDWWTYFGSFGNDIFDTDGCDEDTALA